MNITVVGGGYVGLSAAVMLALKNDVTILDIDVTRVEMINNRIAPFRDELISQYLADEAIQIRAVCDEREAYQLCKFVIIAVPTSYDNERKVLDTTIIDSVMKSVSQYCINAWIVIKSTVSIGYTRSLAEKYKSAKVLYSPEFLREGNALYDSLYPSRLVIGCRKNDEESVRIAKTFSELILDCTEQHDCPVLFMNYNEAEAVKLFSNTYLALRVGFFNELDTYAEENRLDAADIISGCGFDPRIGSDYNNPSFGYGGYCLPKDSMQLLAEYGGIPQRIIEAAVSSNSIRMDYIAGSIERFIEQKGYLVENVCVGVYRVIMKNNSDNYRKSSVCEIIERLRKKYRIIIYEPILNESSSFMGCDVVDELDAFKKRSDIIIANRYNGDLDDVKKKVYTRDIFCNN